MAWETMSFHSINANWQSIERLLSTIRKTHVNGGVILKCFEADDRSLFRKRIFILSNQFESRFQTFLQTVSDSNLLEEFDLEFPLDPLPTFSPIVPLALEGELTHTILSGGAYERFRGSVDEARKLTRDFMASILENQWLSASAFKSDTPWSNWFYDVAWDATYLIFDDKKARIWLLCITDTD
ncbi:hypothetical protein Enr10x_48320 [Gimesia panareensis]|uniref:Uncharacterized protein n=1 Tax=Gimesia panareensis TaxID=2527978 RepID=A0A517QCX4_9PLAN|nr:hypothetical protein [Gimesia panareensis]QDT29477.1 hypothetical protein Enr10x_48320 [Gimesia panareensis]